MGGFGFLQDTGQRGLFVFDGITPNTRRRQQGLDMVRPWDGTRLHKLQFRKKIQKKAPSRKKRANKNKGLEKKNGRAF